MEGCEKGYYTQQKPENILMNINENYFRNAKRGTVASPRNVECGTCLFLDTGGQRAPEGTGWGGRERKGRKVRDKGKD